MIFLNAIQGILSIIILIGVGYYLSYKNWFNDDTGKLFSRMVTSLSLPAYMISNLLSTYDREKLMQLINGLMAPFISMILCYGIGMLVAKLIKVRPNRFGTFSAMFGLSNTIFVGLPINLALFGEQCLPYVMVYYIANTIIFWTIGAYGIRRDGEKIKLKLFTLENVKKIFSPPLTAILLAALLIVLGIKLPNSIMESCKYLGNLTTPLAVLFIGIVIYSVKPTKIKLSKDMVAILLGRFIFAPLLIIGICYKLPLPILMKQVFVIQAAMPVMTQTPIVARMYGADYEYSAVMATVTTIVSLLMIPIYMVLISSGEILSY